MTPPDSNACGAPVGGWLSALAPSLASAVGGRDVSAQWHYTTSGTIPSVGDGVVQRVVCFDYGHAGQLECYKSVVVQVVNCGTHTLWQLPDVPDCANTGYNTVYCTQDQ
jgi:hypothetical protein